MKKLLLLPMVLFGMAACTEAQEPTSFTPEALNSKMTATDGSAIAFEDILKQYEGKPLVIEVWASWCSDCVKNMPKVHSLQKQFPDVQYLFLSYDRDPDAWKRGIEKHNLQGGHYHADKNMKESKFGSAIKLDWIPRYMVVDSTGKIVLHKAVEADDEKLITTLKNLK